MKKKIIICVVLLLVVVAGAAIMLLNSSNSKAGEEKEMSDYNKAVTEYTWEEFSSLKQSEQIKFQNSFESEAELEKWLNLAQGGGEEYIPWVEGGKQPEDYTWEDFNSLTLPQQDKFKLAFDEEDGFDKWLAENKPKDVE